ncbi:hypothetical protein [Adhaeribacter aquaticus]|uniref:hypothetical protein n=1 Tax=Adhaeribacter aquaticus TaxID=299567 RepID=UPI00040C2A5A|nr:hypothetical protein [Adhaeribacter aquaticus]
MTEKMQFESLLADSGYAIAGSINDKVAIHEALLILDFKLDSEGSFSEILKYMALKELLLNRLQEME